MTIKKNATILWFTGLSGSGKTTIAETLKDKLKNGGKSVLIIDGDSIRSTINKKLSFSEIDIKKNNLKVAELVMQKQNEYDFILIPIISPYRKHRELVKQIIGDKFYELYINCSIQECINRDVKGLYKKALNGEITNMIGIAASNPYEPPLQPDLVINTKDLPLQDSIKSILFFITQIVN